MTENGKIFLFSGIVLVGLAFIGGGMTYRHFKQRGIRNNNPGNLVLTDIQWKGKVPRALNKDGKFEQFEDYDGVPGHVWGIRAMFMDVRGDIQRDGLNTIRKLISVYAPTHENNTAAYIASVAKALKKGADAVLVPADYPGLLKAITLHENGVQPYPDADISRAMALA